MAKDEMAPEETESGGKNKMFIIIGAAVAVAVVLGVVAFMLMGKGDKKEKDKEETKTETKAEGGHGGASAGKEGASAGKEGAAAATNVYSLEPFIVNIYDGQELRYLKVKVELEMANAVKGDLDARLAPMRDTILVLLSSKTLQDLRDLQGKNQLKEEILVAINKTITPARIAKVYFTDFVVQ